MKRRSNPFLSVRPAFFGGLYVFLLLKGLPVRLLRRVGSVKFLPKIIHKIQSAHSISQASSFMNNIRNRAKEIVNNELIYI